MNFRELICKGLALLFLVTFFVGLPVMGRHDIRDLKQIEAVARLAAAGEFHQPMTQINGCTVFIGIRPEKLEPGQVLVSGSRVVACVKAYPWGGHWNFEFYRDHLRGPCIKDHDIV